MAKSRSRSMKKRRSMKMRGGVDTPPALNQTSGVQTSGVQPQAGQSLDVKENSIYNLWGFLGGRRRRKSTKK